MKLSIAKGFYIATCAVKRLKFKQIALIHSILYLPTKLLQKYTSEVAYQKHSVHIHSCDIRVPADVAVTWL